MRINIACCLLILFSSYLVCANQKNNGATISYKPVVFFDSSDVFVGVNFDVNNYKVHELNDLNEKYKKIEQIHRIGQQKYLDDHIDLGKKTQNGTVNQALYCKRKPEIDAAYQADEIKYQEDMKPISEQWVIYTKKIDTAVKAVALRRGACAVVGASYLIDPAYDITDEVIAVLNKEYDTSKRN